MKKLVASLILMTAFGLMGCETMKGLGDDISSAGKALKKSASE